MKNHLGLLWVLTGLASTAWAQPDPTVAKQQMKLFADWPGVWKGESVSQMGATAKKSVVEETIQSKLDGTLILFEGTGKTVDPATREEKTVHNALGLLTYDMTTKQYRMKSYLADGRSADAWFTTVSPNHYQWGFDASPGKIRYSITINPDAKTWNEVGEYSRDGSTFAKFFEMNLTKQ